MKLLTFSTSRASRRLAAFSMVEQLVGMSVVGVAITSLFAGFSQGFAIIEAARENLRAAQILCEKTEVLRLYTLEQVTGVTTNGDLFMPRTFEERFFPVGNTNTGVRYWGTILLSNAVIANSPNYASNLMQITFTLTWTNDNVVNRRSVNTLIARNGVQTYIY